MNDLFFHAVKSAVVTAGGILAAMPQVEVNKDGTVKIIPPPAPEPAPEDMKFTPIENQM